MAEIELIGDSNITIDAEIEKIYVGGVLVYEVEIPTSIEYNLNEELIDG